MNSNEDTWSTAARNVADRLQKMPPGPLADLRRMSTKMPSPQFWRLAVRYPNTIGYKGREMEWVTIVRILATLTKKGAVEERCSLHDRKRRLGEVLCDGGDPSWPPKEILPPRPFYSEHRLAQLLATRGTQRAVHLERAMRAVSSNRSVDTGINVVDIAFSILRPQDTRRIAMAYYNRLDRAESAQAARGNNKGNG